MCLLIVNKSAMIFLSSIKHHSFFLGKIIKCYIKVKATEFSNKYNEHKNRNEKTLKNVWSFRVSSNSIKKYNNNNNKKPKSTFSLISCKHFLA